MIPPEKKALISQSGMDDSFRARKIVSSGGASFLSPDKETGPFMLFLLGDDVETVAIKTGYPKDIMLVTALQYHWEEKRAVINQEGPDTIVKDLEKSIVNGLLLATYHAISKEVGAIMAGKVDAANSTWLPKNMVSLQKLLDMVDKINNIVRLNGPVTPLAGNGTSVQANNVQIVNYNGPDANFEDKRKNFLKSLADKAGK